MIYYDRKYIMKRMWARVLFRGILNEDGEVWIARHSAMKEKTVKIFQ